MQSKRRNAHMWIVETADENIWQDEGTLDAQDEVTSYKEWVNRIDAGVNLLK